MPKVALFDQAVKYKFGSKGARKSLFLLNLNHRWPTPRTYWGGEIIMLGLDFEACPGVVFEIMTGG